MAALDKDYDLESAPLPRSERAPVRSFFAGRTGSRRLMLLGTLVVGALLLLHSSDRVSVAQRPRTPQPRSGRSAHTGCSIPLCICVVASFGRCSQLG